MKIQRRHKQEHRRIETEEKGEMVNVRERDAHTNGISKCEQMRSTDMGPSYYMHTHINVVSYRKDTIIAAITKTVFDSFPSTSNALPSSRFLSQSSLIHSELQFCLRNRTLNGFSLISLGLAFCLASLSRYLKCAHTHSIGKRDDMQ